MIDSVVDRAVGEIGLMDLGEIVDNRMESVPFAVTAKRARLAMVTVEVVRV